MTPKEKMDEWVRFIRVSQSSYKMNALHAVMKNDGEAMLEKCLTELGWERSMDLIKNVEPPEQ